MTCRASTHKSGTEMRPAILVYSVVSLSVAFVAHRFLPEYLASRSAAPAAAVLPDYATPGATPIGITDELLEKWAAQVANDGRASPLGTMPTLPSGLPPEVDEQIKDAIDQIEDPFPGLKPRSIGAFQRQSHQDSGIRWQKSRVNE